ncbi:hypothetical protein NP493_7g08000 [Ridgeia piscesae]|uniref:Uncharacterized protein n=1 Tax=Ridgeia piscesae TaxID=27915 RepID=A0AAD9ULD3_RIDPI|nr:hypothetical protein NP493_7g08000 [Ridgeia piscesae]
MVPLLIQVHSSDWGLWSLCSYRSTPVIRSMVPLLIQVHSSDWGLRSLCSYKSTPVIRVYGPSAHTGPLQ